MSGHHSHHHPHGGSSANLKVAFLLNLGFTAIEIAGGLWTNSIAILTDSVHDLGDSISLGLAWYFDRMSQRGRTPRHTYGYGRYRLLGGLITGMMLLAYSRLCPLSRDPAARRSRAGARARDAAARGRRDRLQRGGRPAHPARPRRLKSW
ncbi:MAG: cation transporter [Verrucomicrobiales bacterium]